MSSDCNAALQETNCKKNRKIPKHIEMNTITVLGISRKIWKINIHKLKYVDFFFFLFEMQIKQCLERMTECGPLEKGMANHFIILALRTP